MNRKLIYFLVSIAYLILIVIGLYGVYTVEATLHVKETPVAEPKNKISIAHTEIFGKLERPQVIFDHGKHVEAMKTEGCNSCHPVKDNDIISFDFPKKVKSKSKTDFMNAFHDECIECHKTKKAEDKKSGPVTCAGCHSKENNKINIKYPIVEFDFEYHEKHVKKLKEKIGKDACDQCHHTYDVEEEDESLALVYEDGTEESCYYCHDLTGKKGPKLRAITKISSKKGLNIRYASHNLCLNCHLQSEKELLMKKDKKEDEKAGPIECSKCHTGKYKTIAELEKIPRPDRGQKETFLINIDNAKLKGVPFNHKYHQNNHKTCRGCHHETLSACKKCHTLTGNVEGNWINLADAYHSVLSQRSCIGCHNLKKAEKNCAGCHSFLPMMDIQAKGPKKEICNICHTGKSEVNNIKALSIAGIDTEKVKKEVTIKILEKEFDASKFPHLDIIEKLVKISNDSKLGSYFHKDLETICKGCHHQSRTDVELAKNSPPYCRNCHQIYFDPKNLNKPRLISAYHRQCIKCHEKMELTKGRKCEECHKEKENRKNDNFSTSAKID